MASRTFEDKPAVRERVPLLIGLIGPSGGGKTYSALRLATGIQRVSGGDIFFIDTEARRALHYADRFKFRHLAFGAPFGPLDYLAAIEHCVNKGAKTIVIDSLSHEHEGPGGVLEQHEQEIDRLLKLWKNATRDKVQMTAWAKPKADRRRMINSILQFPCNFICCFRAKEKLKIVPGRPPENRGYMPIAGEEFVFEMTVNGLLHPGANGVPTWLPSEEGEKKMVKLPEQFKQLFSKSEPLSENLGEQMATWAAGTAIDGGLYSELRDAIAMAGELEVLRLVWPRLQQVAKDKSLPPGQYAALVEAFNARKIAIDELIKRREQAAVDGEVLPEDEPPADDAPESARAAQ